MVQLKASKQPSLVVSIQEENMNVFIYLYLIKSLSVIIDWLEKMTYGER